MSLGRLDQLIAFANKDQFSFGEIARDEPVAISYLGTNVLSNLVFPSGAYTDPKTGAVVNYTGIRADSVLFTVNQAKAIVSETVQGADGTVNEYISLGDYFVDFSIYLNGESFDRGGGLFDVQDTGSRFPAADLSRLLVIFKAPVPVAVESRFLNYFGISELLLMNWSAPQRFGSYNTQEIRISAKTELVFDLEAQTIE